jgi:multidrug efflux pump subunit AcrA (membrane-fusion protein)
VEATVYSNPCWDRGSARLLVWAAAVATILMSFFVASVPYTLSQDARAGTLPEANRIVVENALLKTIESTHLAAEVSGRLERLDISEGTKITVGEVLGRVHDSAVQLQMERARIAMAIARKKLRSEVDLQLATKKHEVAQNELERALAANTRTPNTYNPKEVDRLTLVADSTQLEIERAKHERELAELEVMLAENDYRQADELCNRHQLRSPVSGIVVSIGKRVGEWVEPGVELMQIVNTDRLRIEGFVRADEAAQNLMGRPVRASVSVGEDEQSVGGRVAFVSPDVNPLNNQVRVYLEIENSGGHLRPGMRTTAVIDLSAASEPPLPVHRPNRAGAPTKAGQPAPVRAGGTQAP